MNRTRLLTSNQLLNIFSASHIATAIYTTEDMIIEAVTDAMLVSWGKTRDILGLPLAVALPELAGQPFLDQMRNVILTGETFMGTSVPATIEDRNLLRTNYYDYEYKALSDETGVIYGLLHTSADVTERVLGERSQAQEQLHLKRLQSEQVLNEELSATNEELSAVNEELQQIQEQLNLLNVELEERVVSRTASLKASEARLRYLIDDAPVAIAVVRSKDFVVEQANQYILRIWGKSASVLGKTIKEALPEIEGQGFFELLERVFTSGEAFAGTEAPGMMEYSGELRQIFTNFVFKPLKGEDGLTHSVMIVATEVTEQVHARLATEEAKRRFQAMVETTPVAMTILNGPELVVEQVNQPMLDIWRRTAGQVLGKGLLEIFPELKDQPNPERMRRVLRTGRRLDLSETPVTLIAEDGTSHTHYAKFSYDPLLNDEGKTDSVLVTVMNVTELVQSRKDLEDSQAHLQETTEELAASNEELSAINEEMMASNEELAATNEELISTQDHLHENIGQLEASRERFSFLLNTIPQQVWTANPEGELDYVNHVVCKDFGYDMPAIIGHGWQKFIHPEDLPKALERWLNALENGNEYLVEFRLLFADGGYRWHLARAVPMIENGHIRMWLGTNTDIQLQKDKEQKKDEFLSIASHELKTPLTSIKAFNQLMSRGGDPVKLSGFIKKSSEHIYRLEKLITDLLDVTRMNAGKLEYNMQPFSFKQLLIESVENVQHMAPDHQIILENSADITFTGDHFRLEQVMNNFLSNAVKYSPNGEKVIVRSKLEADQIIVSVQDYGIGIDPSHINKLFDRYYRVDNTAMRFEGLGLGLFISSEILKRHQGKVWIESEIGKGSTFYFSIPIIKETAGDNVSSPLDLGTGTIMYNQSTSLS